MSCLNLGKRLQPAKKAWKIFTRKIHSRLHKLHKSNSKTIKKPNNRFKTTTKSVPWLTLTFKPRTLQHKRRTKTTHNLLCHHLHKKTAPVYIDELFKDPSVSSLKNHLQPPAMAKKTKESVEGPEETTGSGAADDMWESLALASPMMHEINQRAEEFITRIHAEMQLQEMIARRL